MIPLAGALALCVACSGSDSAGVEPTTAPSTWTTTPTTTPTPDPNGGPTAPPSSADPTSSASRSASTPSGTSTAGQPSASTATVEAAPAPTAAKTIKAFDRPDAEPRRIAVTGASFGEPVRWADGVELEVVKSASGTTEGNGPGQTAGQPFTRFTLTITNNSSTPVDATSVVITTAYGTKTHLLAAAVYDETSTDFGTTIAVGGSADAVYVFTIPASGRSSVSMTVDLDGTHQPAAIKGSVR